MQKNAPKKYKKMQKIHRNCKNHTKFAKYDVSGITDILPGVSPYWLSPITSFHHIGDNRYDRDILELCVLLLQDLCNRSQGLRCVFITAGPSTKLSYMGGGGYGRTCATCVFYYCRTYYKAVRVGEGGEWRTCAMRDDEPRPVWMSLPITHWDP
jgi:hypothetical protein